LCDPNDGGLHFAVDETGGGIPPAGLARGRAVNGQRCRVSGARFASHGGTRFTGCWFDYDSVIGWHVRHSYSTVSGAAGAAEGLLTTLYDFIQNNMTWTFSGCFYFSSNPSHGQTLFSNNNSTSGNPGIDIVRDQTTRKISVLAGDGTGPRFSEQPIANAPAMSDAGWYYVGLNCAGSGKIDGYVGPFPGLLQPPVLTHFQSTNSVARSNGNFASTKVPSIAQRPDGQNAADLRSKQILLANVAWTAAQHQQAAAQAVYQPSKRGRNRLRNGTIRRLAKDLIGR